MLSTNRLPPATSPMQTQVLETTADLAAKLLTHYSFDLGGYNASELVYSWQKEFPASWLHLAVVEALYQGRYKAISVQQILTMWHRRGQITYHFNMEFERLICSKFPELLTVMAKPILPPAQEQSSIKKQQESKLPLLTANYLKTTETKITPEYAQNSDDARVEKQLSVAVATRNIAVSEEQNQKSSYSIVRETEEKEFVKAFSPVSHAYENNHSQTDTNEGNVASSNNTSSFKYYRNIGNRHSGNDSSYKHLSNEYHNDWYKSQEQNNSNYTRQDLTNHPEPQEKLLTLAISRPPIGQFTPETSESSEFFTSKLRKIR